MKSTAANEASHLRNAWTMVVPLSPIFGVKEHKCLIGYTRANEALESQFPKTVNSFRIG